MTDPADSLDFEPGDSLVLRVWARDGVRFADDTFADAVGKPAEFGTGYGTLDSAAVAGDGLSARLIVVFDTYAVWDLDSRLRLTDLHPDIDLRAR